MLKVVIFTGNRSEYGILYSIIREISKNPYIEYYLIVSGSHLDEDFGKSVSEIESDGFKIYKKITVRKVWEINELSDKVDLFLINQDNSLINTMHKIAKNKNGIVFVVDNNKIVGVVTDGDLRRALLCGKSMQSRVLDFMNKNFISIKDSWNDNKTCDVLESKKMKSRVSKISGSVVLPIVNDNMEIIKMVSANKDSSYRMTNEVADIITKVSDVLSELKPDFFIVYGDRYETFGAAIASTQMMIPTVHIEGGDVTGGVIDDSIRHAITKLAHVHLTTNKDAYQRVLKLGEEPWRVFNIGYPIYDLIKEGNFATEKDVSDKFRIDIDKPLVVFIQHSITTDNNPQYIMSSLNAVELLAKEGVNIVIVYPNNDTGGKAIIDRINEIRGENVRVVKNMSRYFYHGLLNICGEYRGVYAGNSSSGIKETPTFGCPSINIGSRQDGRLRAENVIDVGYDTDEIIKAVRFGLFDNEFRDKCRNCTNPYVSDNAGKKVVDILLNMSKSKNNLLQKKIMF